MGLVRKGNMEKYWDHGETVKTPFFGTYMSRNTFQSILSNFQITDSANDLPRNNPSRDRLFRVRPFIDMLERTFKNAYRCGRDLSFDEGCCPFKGRAAFKCYNPSKPAKWHLKLFEVTDAKTGYVAGFEVFMGKGKTACSRTANVMDPNCTITTKTVFGLCEKTGLLDRGHHIFMDNYYTSPELFEELHYRETFAAGTCRSNRKNLPRGVTKAKLREEAGDCVFRRNGPLLCFKWKQQKRKKPVMMLTTIHEAVLVDTGKKDKNDVPIEKPEAVYYYCQKMGGVDLSDQLLNYYTFLRKSIKWSRKLIIHLFNMCILNAYILNKHYGCEKLSHDGFRDRLVKYLIGEGMKSYNIPLPPVLSRKLTRASEKSQQEGRLSERHFISYIPKGEGRKRDRPQRDCFVCSKIPQSGQILKPKRTSYWCEDCKKPMCITPCFRIYHTEIDFKMYALEYRNKVLVSENVQNVQ